VAPTKKGNLLHSKGNKLHPLRPRSDTAGQLVAERRRGDGRCLADRDSRPTAGPLRGLPLGAAIEQMLADCQVVRDQARACRNIT
jgi:hypothetical protein